VGSHRILTIFRNGLTYRSFLHCTLQLRDGTPQIAAAYHNKIDAARGASPEFKPR